MKESEWKTVLSRGRRTRGQGCLAGEREGSITLNCLKLFKWKGVSEGAREHSGKVIWIALMYTPTQCVVGWVQGGGGRASFGAALDPQWSHTQTSGRPFIIVHRMKKIKKE